MYTASPPESEPLMHDEDISMTHALPTGPLPGWLEQAWLQRYLDRELTDLENEWFEAYAIDKAELIAAIDTDNTLRDAMHAWHAQQLAKSAARFTASPQTIAETAATYAAPVVARDARWAASDNRRPTRWFRPLVAAASLTVAAVLGASAAQWTGQTGSSGSLPVVSSPRRVVFDNLRGGATAAPLVSAERSAGAVLIDIAVPPQAEAVVAHFSDGSSLNLDVSNDGFVSLVGASSELQRLSPIRVSYRSDGHSVERALDLSAVL